MMQRKEAKILKLDIHKAYDTVNWEFLRETLLLFAFPNLIVNLIMFNISNMRTSILLHGEILPQFNSGRGLLKGDPLSSSLRLPSWRR